MVGGGKSGAGVEIKTRGSGLRGFGPETCSLHGFGPKFGSPGGLLDMLVSETVPGVGLIEYDVLPGSSIRICTPPEASGGSR